VVCGARDPVRAQGRRAGSRRDPPGPGRRRELPGFLREAVAEAGRDLAVAYASDGDAALLVDPNPRQVVSAARALRQRLLHSGYRCDIPLRRRCRLRRCHRGRPQGAGADRAGTPGRGPPRAARTPGCDPGDRPVRRGLARSFGGRHIARPAGRAARGAAAARERRPLRSRQAGRRGPDASADPAAGRAGLSGVMPGPRRHREHPDPEIGHNSATSATDAIESDEGECPYLSGRPRRPQPTASIE
jgi:hypothetical protein